jgi:hypothetical protein
MGFNTARLSRDNVLSFFIVALMLTLPINSAIASASMGSGPSGTDAIVLNKTDTSQPVMRSTTNAQRQAAAARIAAVKNAQTTNTTYDWQLNETQVKILQQSAGPQSYSELIFAVVLVYIFIISMFFYLKRKKMSSRAPSEVSV